MIDGLLWPLFLIGHIGLWCVIFNRVHATAFPRKARKASEKVVLLAVGLPLLWILIVMGMQGQYSFGQFAAFRWIGLYLYASVLMGCFFIARWGYRKWTLRLPNRVIESRREVVYLAKEIGAPYRGRFAKLLGQVPFNEASLMSVEHMTIELDVPQALDGFRICQLSDLHFTGQIALEYFQRLIQRANEFKPDLIVITGDLIDVETCFDWLDKTLGKLEAKYGVHYVLGNHDLRIQNTPKLRQRLEELGLMQVSGRWVDVDVNGATIRVTGNELPWFHDVDQLPEEPERVADLRILLSHSPDQLDWARSRSFDLMFAGHTHGGQIAFPLIGPVVAPSKYGVLYASGTFEFDQMIMHVSRGISGDEPIRFCSPPEIGCFTVVQANDAKQDG